MVNRWVYMIAGAIGMVIVAAFVLGLSYSISTGFAGFWGGLPFAIIAIGVLALLAYDFWDECIRRKDNI